MFACHKRMGVWKYRDIKRYGHEALYRYLLPSKAQMPEQRLAAYTRAFVGSGDADDDTFRWEDGVPLAGGGSGNTGALA